VGTWRAGLRLCHSRLLRSGGGSLKGGLGVTQGFWRGRLGINRLEFGEIWDQGRSWLLRVCNDGTGG
jgi:hypothetical protein